MTTRDIAAEYDHDTPDPVEIRFGIESVDYQEANGVATLRMPAREDRNPMTGGLTSSALAVLIDVAGGRASFSRRRNRWPVTSELDLQLGHDAHDVLRAGEYAQARARVISASHGNALVLCEVTVDGRSIGTATLRTVFVSTGPAGGVDPEETLVKTSDTPLADLMAVTTVREQGADCLSQSMDPMILNTTGVVHGGVAAAGAELVAASAVAEKAGDLDLRTGSLRVNYLRPFLAGPASRYLATAIHTGATVAVADAQALGDNGSLALRARVTAYRAS